MPTTSSETTLVSLFHTQEYASKAISDLQAAGIPMQSIQTLGGDASKTSAPEQSLTTLKSLNLPSNDLQILSDGLKGGGTLIIVRTGAALADKVENVFERHYADKIDERGLETKPKAAANLQEGAVIPVVEERLVVGKREVKRGGLRVYSRIVEVPVEEQIVLREEHATVQRQAVNRPISEAELNALQNQSIEVREMAEEAVVGKTARVVEEVRVGKDSTERTQQITDTVRKTKVEVDQLATDQLTTDQLATGVTSGTKKKI